MNDTTMKQKLKGLREHLEDKNRFLELQTFFIAEAVKGAPAEFPASAFPEIMGAGVTEHP